MVLEFLLGTPNVGRAHPPMAGRIRLGGTTLKAESTERRPMESLGPGVGPPGEESLPSWEPGHRCTPPERGGPELDFAKGRLSPWEAPRIQAMWVTRPSRGVDYPIRLSGVVPQVLDVLGPGPEGTRHAPVDGPGPGIHRHHYPAVRDRTAVPQSETKSRGGTGSSAEDVELGASLSKP